MLNFYLVEPTEDFDVQKQIFKQKYNIFILFFLSKIIYNHNKMSYKTYSIETLYKNVYREIEIIYTFLRQNTSSGALGPFLTNLNTFTDSGIIYKNGDIPYAIDIDGTPNQINVNKPIFPLSMLDTKSVEKKDTMKKDIHTKVIYTYTLSTPQDIALTSTPTFAGMTLNGQLNMTTHKIINLADPVNPLDAVNLQTLTGYISGDYLLRNGSKAMFGDLNMTSVGPDPVGDHSIIGLKNIPNTSPTPANLAVYGKYAVNLNSLVDFAQTHITTILDNDYLKLDGTNQMGADLNFGNFKGINAQDPVNPQDVVTLNYLTTHATAEDKLVKKYTVSSNSSAIAIGDLVGIQTDGTITKGYEDPQRYNIDYSKNDIEIYKTFKIAATLFVVLYRKNQTDELYMCTGTYNGTNPYITMGIPFLVEINDNASNKSRTWKNTFNACRLGDGIHFAVSRLYYDGPNGKYNLEVKIYQITGTSIASVISYNLTPSLSNVKTYIESSSTGIELLKYQGSNFTYYLYVAIGYVPNNGQSDNLKKMDAMVFQFTTTPTLTVGYSLTNTTLTNKNYSNFKNIAIKVANSTKCFVLFNDKDNNYKPTMLKTAITYDGSGTTVTGLTFNIFNLFSIVPNMIYNEYRQQYELINTVTPYHFIIVYQNTADPNVVTKLNDITISDGNVLVEDLVSPPIFHNLNGNLYTDYISKKDSTNIILFSKYYQHIQSYTLDLSTWILTFVNSKPLNSPIYDTFLIISPTVYIFAIMNVATGYVSFFTVDGSSTIDLHEIRGITPLGIALEPAPNPLLTPQISVCLEGIVSGAPLSGIITNEAYYSHRNGTLLINTNMDDPSKLSGASPILRNNYYYTPIHKAMGISSDSIYVKM